MKIGRQRSRNKLNHRQMTWELHTKKKDKNSSVSLDMRPSQVETADCTSAGSREVVFGT